MTLIEYPACIWKGHTQPRSLKHQHLQQCPDNACRGCQPCEAAHCLACGVTHHDSVCLACRHGVRLDLDALAVLADADRLRDQAQADGLDSEAMNALGPVGDPCATYETVDARHPLWVAHSWARLIREQWDVSEPHGRVRLADELDYLQGNLDRIADDLALPFAELATQLTHSRHYLEGILKDGEQRDTGAPCLRCERGIYVKHWADARHGEQPHDAQARDTWICSYCHHEATSAEYRLAVAVVFSVNSDWLNLAQAAMRLGTSEGNARLLAHRQHWGRRRQLIDHVRTVKVFCAVCIDRGGAERCERHADLKVA
jgi:hypothetical protein